MVVLQQICCIGDLYMHYEGVELAVQVKALAIMVMYPGHPKLTAYVQPCRYSHIPVCNFPEEIWDYSTFFFPYLSMLNCKTCDLPLSNILNNKTGINQ